MVSSFVIHLFIVYPHTGRESSEAAQSNASSRLVTVNDFLCKAELDNINLFPLIRFCETSKISQKLSGFSEWNRAKSQVAMSQMQTSTVSVCVIGLLTLLLIFIGCR